MASTFNMRTTAGPTYTSLPLELRQQVISAVLNCALNNTLDPANELRKTITALVNTNRSLAQDLVYPLMKCAKTITDTIDELRAAMMFLYREGKTYMLLKTGNPHRMSWCSGLAAVERMEKERKEYRTEKREN